MKMDRTKKQNKPVQWLVRCKFSIHCIQWMV